MKLVALFALLVCCSKAILAGELALDSPAPDFTLASIEAQRTISLADYRGKVVYLDFWASWCVACRKSFPFLSALRQQYAAQGFEVIAINLDQDPAAAQRFLDNYPVDYPVALGYNSKIAEDYHVTAMPMGFFVDSKGTLRLQHLGFSPKHQDFLTAVLEKLLAER